MYTIQYTARAVKSLEKVSLEWKKRIVKAIDGLASNPFLGKKLSGKLKGIFSMRVWPYRVLYIIQKEKITVVILDIGHRQGIYN